MRLIKRLIVLAIALRMWTGVQAQLSKPILEDESIPDHTKHIFRGKQATRDKGLDLNRTSAALDLPRHSACHREVVIKWSQEVSSSVYGTPVITDLFSDGIKDILVPSFLHYLDALEGPTGAAAPGYPADHHERVHASPILYDVDGDGVQDIMLATFSGELLWFSEDGQQRYAYYSILPRLRVRKEWYKGLRANPDIRDDERAEGAQGDDGAQAQADAQQNKAHQGEAQQAQGQAQGQAQAQAGGSRRRLLMAAEDEGAQGDGMQGTQVNVEEGEAKMTNEGVQSFEVFADSGVDAKEARKQARTWRDGDLDDGDTNLGGDADQISEQELDALRRHYHVDDYDDDLLGHELDALEGHDLDQYEGHEEAGEEDHDAWRRKHDLEGRDHHEEAGEEDHDAWRRKHDLEGRDHHEEAGEEDHDAWRRKHDLEGRDHHEYDDDDLRTHAIGGDDADGYYDDDDALDGDFDGGDGSEFDKLGNDGDLDLDHGKWNFTGYDDYDDWDADWDHHAGSWGEYSVHEPVKGFVDIDAHILGTPAVGDIDGDGADELVIGASFFFDKDYYDRAEHRWEVAKDLDMTKYVAGAVIAWDIKNRAEKWRTHLDLSTDSAAYRAYIYSSPVLADLDADGLLETIIGTSAGLVYVLDSKGSSVEGWPVEMGEVQATPLVADLNGDGWPEVFAADMKGNVALFDRRGKLIWSRHLGGAISAAPMAADVDGDGHLEIILGAHSGEVHVLRGADGRPTGPFPFMTGGRIMAPPLAVDLAGRDKKSGRMDVVVPSFDGYLYIIDGDSGCAEAIDVGETAYAQVLADDLDGDGTLDLVLATMNGQVVALETRARYHPLRAWTGPPQGNQLVAADRYMGVHAAWDTRAPRDLRGETFPVRFTLVDRRPGGARNVSAELAQRRGHGPYRVLVMLEGVGVTEMRAGEAPVIGLTDNYRAPGTHTLVLPAPKSRTTATVTIRMVDPHGRVHRDSFALSFHVNFYRMLKWVLAGPFVACAVWALLMSGRADPFAEDISLPIVQNERMD